jgi:hypothetical protein
MNQKSEMICAGDLVLARHLEIPERASDFFNFDIPHAAIRNGEVTIRFERATGVARGSRMEREIWRKLRRLGHHRLRSMADETTIADSPGRECVLDRPALVKYPSQNLSQLTAAQRWSVTLTRPAHSRPSWIYVLVTTLRGLGNDEKTFSMARSRSKSSYS